MEEPFTFKIDMQVAPFFFAYFNCSDHDIYVKKGDVIGQVIFQKYLTVDDDNSSGVRTGGFGSTDEKNKK